MGSVTPAPPPGRMRTNRLRHLPRLLLHLVLLLQLVQGDGGLEDEAGRIPPPAALGQGENVVVAVNLRNLDEGHESMVQEDHSGNDQEIDLHSATTAGVIDDHDRLDLADVESPEDDSWTMKTRVKRSGSRDSGSSRESYRSSRSRSRSRRGSSNSEYSRSSRSRSTRSRSEGSRSRSKRSKRPRKLCIEQHVAFAGETIRYDQASSAKECMHLCKETRRCRAFNYNSRSGGCAMKGSDYWRFHEPRELLKFIAGGQQC